MQCHIELGSKQWDMGNTVTSHHAMQQLSMLNAADGRRAGIQIPQARRLTRKTTTQNRVWKETDLQLTVDWNEYPYSKESHERSR